MGDVALSGSCLCGSVAYEFDDLDRGRVPHAELQTAGSGTLQRRVLHDLRQPSAACI